MLIDFFSFSLFFNNVSNDYSFDFDFSICSNCEGIGKTNGDFCLICEGDGFIYDKVYKDLKKVKEIDFIYYLDVVKYIILKDNYICLSAKDMFYFLVGGVNKEIVYSIPYSHIKILNSLASKDK